MSVGARYFKVDNLTRQQEQAYLKAGKKVRNFGRLDEEKIEELVKTDLDYTQNPCELLKKRRPWRLQRFLQELIATEDVLFGVSSYAGYKLRVLNGGIEGVFGKFSTSTLQSVITAVLDRMNGREEREYWESFKLWKSLLGTSLINLLPDRPFALYVYAKDPVGDDVPIYYMELEINGDTDRHVLLWELDQVLTSPSQFSRPHEGSRASEFCSAYQKVYFYINWEEKTARRVVRAVIADLPKPDKDSWDSWLRERHEDHYFDALISIFVIGLCTFLSFSQVTNQPVISLIGGVVVAGIASEEWMPPQAVLLGAISRFFANESLSLRMYYRTDYTLSIKSVLISLLASVAEVSDIIVGAEPACRIPETCNVQEAAGSSECLLYSNSTKQNFRETIGNIFQPSPCNCCSFNNRDFVLAIAGAINIALLLHTAFSGVYGAFSHSDYPSRNTYFPKIYVEKTGFFRQLITDCRPVEEFCSVYRPLLHWQRGIQNRFLGDAVDLAAPGAPPSMLCYWLASPASSKIAQNYLIYGTKFHLHLLPLAVLEQSLALLGGLLTIVLDFPITLALFLVLLLKRVFSLPRPMVRVLVAASLHIYDPVQLLLSCVDAYNGVIARLINLDTLECRGRSTARLYRWALIKSVRTGRSSNHSWKFGDHLYDDGYFRCSDCIIVNPRTPKLGMVEANKLFYKRHKLLWTTNNGVRYINPCLSCGDNTVSRRSSLIRQTSEHMAEIHRTEDIPDVKEYMSDDTHEFSHTEDEDENEFDTRAEEVHQGVRHSGKFLPANEALARKLG